MSNPTWEEYGPEETDNAENVPTWEEYGPEDLSSIDTRSVWEKAGPGPQGLDALTPEEVQSGVEATKAFGRGGLQGATAGFSDELIGIEQTLIDRAIDDPLGAAQEIAQMGSSPFVTLAKGIWQRAQDPKFREEYKAARDAERAANKAAEEAHPAAYLSGEIGGSVASSALPIGAAANVGRVAQGAQKLSTLAKVGRRIATGAPVGALIGAGYSEGETPAEILADTASGAAVGAIGGVVGETVIAPVAKTVAKKLKTAFATANKKYVLRAMKEVGFDVRGDKIYDAADVPLFWDDPKIKDIVSQAEKGVLPSKWFRSDSQMLRASQDMQRKAEQSLARKEARAITQLENAATEVPTGEFAGQEIPSILTDDALAELQAAMRGLSKQKSVETVNSQIADQLAGKLAERNPTDLPGFINKYAGRGAKGAATWAAAQFLPGGPVTDLALVGAGQVYEAYGNQAILKALGAMKNNPKFGRTISSLVARGDKALLSGHYVLMQTNADYRQAFMDAQKEDPLEQ